MVETVQRSFTGGEISPSLRSRADLGKYTTGLALCKNMFVRAQGGVYSRPGLRFIGEVGDSSGSVRLIPFSFNTEQNYVLVFQNLTMRVIKDGAFVPAFELVTPYTEDQLSRLKYTQDADTMTITHQSHAPANLTRLADDNWSLDDINYESSVPHPVILTNSSTILDTVSSVMIVDDETVRFTIADASELHEGFDVEFQIDWSGLPDTIQGVISGNAYKITSTTSTTFDIGLYNVGLTDNSTYGLIASLVGETVGTGTGDSVRDYFYVVTSVNKNGVESLQSPSMSTYQIQPLSSDFGVKMFIIATGTGVERQDVDFFRIYKDSNNSGKYGWVSDSKSLAGGATFTDFNIAPDYSDSPPIERTVFNDSDNYPAVVNYYQQRQVFANTYSQPQTIYTTRTGYYNSLQISDPLRDDDALTFTIASNRVNEIRHLVSLDALIPLTSGGEWMITEGQDQVLTPSTLGARIKSYNGASWVEPAIIDDTAVYVQEKGNRIRDLKYAVADNTYQGNDLSIMAEHLFEDKQIVEMSYADEPYGILWCVRDDGVLLGMTYNREQNVWGWHQHDTDGLFESITTIGEDDRDAVYVCVNRTIEGVTKRYIERLEKRITNDVNDCFYVDSGLSYDGAPTKTFSGLNHLEGQSVVVLADGVVINGLTVESGSITLDDEYSVVHVGLPYTPRMEMLQIDIPSMQQSLKGKTVNISTLYIEIEKSRGLWAGVQGEEMREVTPREVIYDYSAPPLNTWVEPLSIQPRWSDGREVGSSNIAIEQRDPLPMSILSVTAEVDIG